MAIKEEGSIKLNSNTVWDQTVEAESLYKYHDDKLLCFLGIHRRERGQGNVVPFPFGLPTLQGDDSFLFLSCSTLGYSRCW